MHVAFVAVADHRFVIVARLVCLNIDAQRPINLQAESNPLYQRQGRKNTAV